MKKKFGWKKVLAWGTNILLVSFFLMLIVPNWRVGFLGWYQSWFLPDAVFSENIHQDIRNETEKWALFDPNDELLAFSELYGKPVVISFWATWCPPCRAELPELADLKEKFGKEISVIAVTEETGETIQKSGLNDDYDFLYFTEAIPSVFNVQSYPRLVIINSKVELIYCQNGAASLDTPENEKFIHKLISDKK